MTLQENLNDIIENNLGPKDNVLHQLILSSSEYLARNICGFANSHGGYILFGSYYYDDSNINFDGLPENMYVNQIVIKALNEFTSELILEHDWILHEGKKFYLINIKNSETKLNYKGVQYNWIDGVLKIEDRIDYSSDSFDSLELRNLYIKLENYGVRCTASKSRLIIHYKLIMRLINEDKDKLFLQGIESITSNSEGKILQKILFSSVADNLEIYLSDLLLEIYIAKPSTLMSNEKVEIKDVLSKSNMNDFVNWWAETKVQKLKKGSLRGFLSENKVIAKLNIIDDSLITKLEDYLQIRHIYTHGNGFVDGKFLENYTGNPPLGSEFQFSIKEFIDKMETIIEVIHKLDEETIRKYNLSLIDT